MFFIPLVVSLTSLLCSVPVSYCDEECAPKPVFTPSTLVVKHGDSATATCTVCPSCTERFNLEKAIGSHTKNNNTTITWTVDRFTEWSTKPQCYYGVKQCRSLLPVIVYKPPDSVSFSLTHSGPMLEAHQYTLQCNVKNVAPVQNLVVTFHRGQNSTVRLNSTSEPQKKPVSKDFSLSITASREDDGAQYWCEAKLELGPDGPQPPPVVMSQKITATVHYKPHVERSFHPEHVVVTVGDRLQLNCSAEGNPPPSFTWLLPGRGPPGPPLTATPLIIQSVTVQDEGQYVCYITNYMGTVNTTYNVQVKELELTSTSLPPTTTATTTTTTTTTTTAATTTATTTAPTTAPTTAATTTATTTAPTTAATTRATTTTATTTTPTTTQTTTPELTTAPGSSTSIPLTHWFITWILVLFSLVI